MKDERRRTADTRTRTVCVVVGTILAVLGARVLPYYFTLWGPVVWVIGIGIVLYGCYLWTRLKSRHWAWMLFGLLAPIGFLVLYGLKNKTTGQEAPSEAIGEAAEIPVAEEILQPKETASEPSFEAVAKQLKPRYCEKCGSRLEVRRLEERGFDRDTGYPECTALVACPYATIYETDILHGAKITWKGRHGGHSVEKVSIMGNPENPRASVVGGVDETQSKQTTALQAGNRITRGFRTLPKGQKRFVIGAAIVILGIIILFGIAPYHGFFQPDWRADCEVVYDTGDGRQTILVHRCTRGEDIVTRLGYWTPAPFRWKYHDEVMVIDESRIITIKH